MNERLFAIGDIHGCFDSFQKLVENKIGIRKNDQLVLLGDYIDRGTQSKEVVDYILELLRMNFNVIPLMGNHEAMLLDALENNQHLSLWFQNGGLKTLNSFGIRLLKDISPLYIGFFKGLPHYYSFKNYLFVHAGFNDEMNNPFEDPYQMLWSRRENYTNPALRDKTIIHGHTPITASFCRKIVQSNHPVINIDTGCVYSDEVDYGRLTAIELYSREIFSI